MTSSRKRLIAIDRNQNVLRAIDIEGLIDDDHQARAIWDFVARLDLSAFYAEIDVHEGDAGRPAWDPRLLVSIWIYAYSRGIGSAREIERLCAHDPAFQWLTGMEVINHHTLSSFRMGQKSKLDDLFQQVLALLMLDGLVTLERVMHDGTKIKASASSNTFRREERIREHLKLAREQVEAMGDPRLDLDDRKRKARERSARERTEKLEQALKELENLRTLKKGEDAKRQARVSITDPEARVMVQPGGGYAPSYNAQISTDEAYGIVIGARLSQSGVDGNELVPSIDELYETFGETPKQVVVDKGYSYFENVMAFDERKVDLIAPVLEYAETGRASFKRHGISDEFRTDKFVYDPKADTFTCPAGKRLTHNGSEKKNGRVKVLYVARTQDCQSCPFKMKCSPKSKRGRAISRSLEYPALSAFRKKMETEEAKQIYKLRSGVAEFSNAWLKSKNKLRQFCVRGREKAELELRWACMALNIQHWARLAWA